MQYRNNAEVPFSAYITNLGKYTEGRTEGEWVDFPTTKEKLQETMKRIGIGDKRADGTVYEEIFITDYDYNLPELVQLNLGGKCCISMQYNCGVHSRICPCEEEFQQ